MYDPQKRLELEQFNREFHDLVENSENLSQRDKDNFYAMAEILEQHADDYDNCFDPDEKEKLRLEGLKMLEDLDSLMELWKPKK